MLVIIILFLDLKAEISNPFEYSECLQLTEPW